MTKAAQILHVTQPTLSRQLKALEEELGKTLFIRHAFRIELTEEGRLLRKRAEDLVDMADKITNEFPPWMISLAAICISALLKVIRSVFSRGK